MESRRLTLKLHLNDQIISKLPLWVHLSRTLSICLMSCEMFLLPVASVPMMRLEHVPTHGSLRIFFFIFFL